MAQFRADTAKAVQFHDSERMNSANTRRKHLGVTEARATLLKSMPSEPTAPGVTPTSVVAGLNPTTTDAVAIQARELAIADRLVASGRPLAEVTHGASAERLAAIAANAANAANAEVFPDVLPADDPASVVKGIHDHVFEALVETGHPPAVIAQDAQAQFDEQAAWREGIKDSIEGRETGAGFTTLFNADREGIDALMTANTDPVRGAERGQGGHRAGGVHDHRDRPRGGGGVGADRFRFEWHARGHGEGARVPVAVSAEQARLAVGRTARTDGGRVGAAGAGD